MRKMTKEELKKRYDYFCSPVRDEDLITKEKWAEMTPEERKKVLTPRKI
jgi:hypothetical protein